MRRTVTVSFLSCALFVALVLQLGVLTTPAHADWKVSGRVVDAETGRPVTGVRYVVFGYEGGRLILESDGLVKADGRFSSTVFGDRPWAVVWVGSNQLYRSMWHDGEITPDYPYTWFPSTLALKGAAADARRVKRDYDGASFGDVRMRFRPLPNGAITGRVYDKYSNKGVTASEIRTHKWDAERARWISLGVDRSPMDDGRFAILGQPGELTTPFRLSVRISTATGWKETFYPYGATVEDAPDLLLQPGQILTGVDAQSDVPNRLRGSVIRTESKKPIERALIRWYRKASDGSWYEKAQGETDDSGDYCSKVLPPGVFRISSWDRFGSGLKLYFGQARSLETARAVTLEQGGVGSNLDIWLSRESALAGTVVDAEGGGRPDVRVTAFRKDAGGTWHQAGSDFTDGSGRYRILCEPGTYTARFSDLAGTPEPEDDMTFFHGGYDSIGDAVSVTVLTDRTRVLSTFSLTAPADARSDRIYGNDDCESALAASRATFDSGEATSVVLACDDEYSDAVAASGLAGTVNSPLLLTNRKRLYRPIFSELDRLGARKVYLVGSAKSISTQQLRLLKALGYTVERIGGADRYDLSARVLRRVVALSQDGTSTPVFVVGAKSRADGLIVGPAAYANRGAVLFVDPKTRTPSPVAQVVTSLGLTQLQAVGSFKSVPTKSLRRLRDCGIVVNRITTSTSSYTRAAAFASVAERRGWLESEQLGLGSTSELSGALGGMSALGRSRSPMLLTARTRLPGVTKSAIVSRGATIRQIHAFARPSGIRADVLIAAGAK